MKRSCIVTLGLLGALAGCGGGGGGGSMPQAQMPQPQNLEAAPAPAEPFNIPSTTNTVSSGGNSYTGTYSETPNTGTTMFDGQNAHSSTIALTISENGSPIITEIDTAYYLENPYQPLGLTRSYNGVQFELLYNSTNPLPSTLTVGSSGPLGSGTYYVDSTNDAVGSLTETYSVTSNSTSWVQLTTYATGMVNGQSINESISYGVYATGAVGLLNVGIVVNGTTLNFNDSSYWTY